MLVLTDVLALFHADVSRISVRNGVILPNQLTCFLDIMDICCRSGDGMDIPGSSIHTGVNLHAVIPLIALFRLMHLWIPLSGRIFVRTRCGSDGGIHRSEE